MPKIFGKKIPMFDKAPSMSATPAGVEDYVAGDAKTAFDSYQGRQPGLLTGIGRALSGVSAPFLGDFEYAMKQQKLQQQTDEADNEFRRYLLMSGKGQQIFTIDPTTGGVVPIGVVPKGSKVVTNPNAPTADMKNQRTTTKQASALFKDLKTRSEALKGGYEGMGEIAKGAVNRGKGESAKYRTYMSNLPGTAVSLYRAVTGDTRLSDADAQARALPLLWHPSEDVDTRSDKNNHIQTMLDARERLLGSGQYPDGVVPWEAVLGEAKQDVTPDNGDMQMFNVNGTKYNIPKDKIDAFKKAKGIK